MPGALYQIYRCAACGYLKRRPHGTGAPTCCGELTKWVRTATLDDPRAPQFGKAPGIDFRNTSPIEVPIGRHGMRFDSLRELRKFEAETQAMEADGVGMAHIVRGYSQEPGNMGVHTMGENPDIRPDLSRTHQDGTPRVQIHRTDGAGLHDADLLGPGVDESLASSLPDTPG